MEQVIAFFTTRIGRIVSAIVAGAALVFGLIQYGKKEQRDEDRVNDLEAYIDTKKRIDNVEGSPDRDAAVDRLRRNGWLG